MKHLTRRRAVTLAATDIAIVEQNFDFDLLTPAKLMEKAVGREVTIDGSHPGTRPASLSYLTPGLGWKADYVALYNESDSKIDVQGWVTLTNSSGTTYDNAQTLLVAGNAEASFKAAGSNSEGAI